MTDLRKFSVREAQAIVCKSTDVAQLKAWLEHEHREPVRCWIVDRAVQLRRQAGEGRYGVRFENG